MSWMKKRGPSTTPSPNSIQQPPPVPMYNPNQHNSQEWQNQTTNPNWYNLQQQTPQQQYQDNPNYWPQNVPPPPQQQQHQQQQNYPNQQPAPPFNQNFGQYQDTASFFNNTNNYQQPQQNYANLQYNQQYGQNYAPPQQQQQQETADSWGNWGWGDEDNSNVQNNVPPQQNLVETEPDNAWNWSVTNEDTKKEEELFPKVKLSKQQSMDEATLQKPVNSHLRNVRGKLETPQWSTESQMSQESSDHTSESDRMISRSSTISHSPISGHDMLPTPNELEENIVQKEEAEANQEIVSTFHSGEDLNGKNNKKFRSLPPPAEVRRFDSNYQQVNLETLPDNAEQPDLVVPTKNWPENNEAPINDRNQYLETGQLSDNNDYRSNRSDNDSLPPPGLRRMVLGQIEQSETLVGNAVDDPPPPGLSRMVLGQTEAPPSSQEPPEGLRRMIPGESSSPESSLRQEQQFEASQPRSATIGADTPPATSMPTSNSSQGRTEALIGSSQENSNNRLGAIGVGSGENVNDGDDFNNLTNSVRNLTVGENLTDGQTSNNSLQDSRRHSHNSRQESSEESDRELKKLSRNRDKRSTEKKREAERSRQHKDRDYSPDNYKEKKYDRRRYNKRYEDDTDYYSDKEKDRRRAGEDRDRDYDRKYSSLRKDKDKDRRRKDYRRSEYYYRYDDEYDGENRNSRPSSRSDSMHESYRERNDRDRRHRDRDRDRERYRRHRGEPRDYNPYQKLQGYAYDPYNPYYQYQYYENLRRTNPQAYAEWYRKYYQQAASQSSAYGGEDRASVHSGRSSANDDSKDRYTRQSFYSQASFSQMGGYYLGGDQSLNMSGQYSVGMDNHSYARGNHYYQPPTDASLNLEDTTNRPALRLTPEKFSTAHLKVSIGSGRLLKIPPSYIMDGQSATVEILSLQSMLMNDDEFIELNKFPGPLVKGVTHKKTIIEYCENKIRYATGDIIDCDSYILMWELLILLIRQNGMVVGTDIAELLLKNHESNVARPPSVQSNLSSKSNVGESMGEVNSSEFMNSNSCLKEEEVTNKFRDYLLYGSCKEALEWAMKHGLWGHALFLASKLDKRTYANVMMRFANGLTLNDPLQTLYQLLSGKMPAAVSCVADEKWGDWRPHLAMILSNSTQRPDLNCRAITALGDTLFSRGSLYAAQFCYLMAQVGFGPFDNPETKLVLLGADHTKGYPHFATNEAIHMTEIYEYACSLNDPNFIIPDFQVYKYILATRLADRGLLEKSLQYLEKVSKHIVENPSSLGPQVVDNVCNLADRLKFYDPVGDADVDESEFGGILETSRPDNSWLKDLRAVQNDYKSGFITHHHHQQPISSFQTATASTLDPSSLASGGYEQESYQQYGAQLPQQQQQQQQFDDYPSLQDYNNSQQQPVQEYQNDYQQSQQSYWDPNLQQQQQWNAGNTDVNNYQQDQQNEYYSNNAQSEVQQPDGHNMATVAQPQISMPNQSKGRSIFDDDQPLGHENQSKGQSNDGAKSSGQNSAKGAQAQADKPASTGWFGGIFSKLSIKPKNQMKLPDDKNPKIVWDQDKQRWVNMDEEDNGPASDFKPPPKMSDLMPKSAPTNLNQFQTANSNLAAPSVAKIDSDNNNDIGKPPIPQQNMFKLQRGRNLKKSYVDVFNPNGKATDGGAVKPVTDQGIMSQNANNAAPMNFFIPQPVNDPNAPMDFLTPAPPMQFNEQAN